MFNFPWSNFHELNLDWVLSVVKEAKEIFVKGEGDIQHAVETADQALETAEQAAAGVIADGAVTIPKINGEVYSLLAYCVSGSVAPNFIPAGALVILRKSTIYNVTDGIYTATRNIPQAAIITAADLDQSATLYREGGMNYLLHNEEKLSHTIDLIKDGLVILVSGDEASAAVPADGLVYVVNNTHGLTEGFYFNSSGAEFPTTGGTADADSFTAVNNILNALQTAVATLGSDDISNDSTVTGASVTDALDAVKNTLNQLDQNMAYVESGNTASRTYTGGEFISWKGTLYTASTAIPQNDPFAIGTNLAAVPEGGLNDLKKSLGTPDSTYHDCLYRMTNGAKEWINPPLVIGNEYRTIERFQGKPVYQYLWQKGAITASASQQTFTLPAAVSTNIYSGVDITPFAGLENSTGLRYWGRCLVYAFPGWGTAERNSFTIFTDDTVSPAYFLFKYTKTTD